MRLHREIYSQPITLFNLCIYQNDYKNHVAEHGLRDSNQRRRNSLPHTKLAKRKIQQITNSTENALPTGCWQHCFILPAF